MNARARVCRSEDNLRSSLHLTPCLRQGLFAVVWLCTQNCHPVSIQKFSHPHFPSGYRSAGIADHTTVPGFMILGLTLRSSCSHGRNFTHWVIFPARPKPLLVFETGFYDSPGVSWTLYGADNDLEPLLSSNGITGVHHYTQLKLLTFSSG